MAAGTILVSEVRSNAVVIERIGLPYRLLAMGYSGEVAAHRLWDAVARINDVADTHKGRTTLVAESRLPKVVEPGSGLSLVNLADTFRQVLGIEQARVAGEFVCTTAACELGTIELRLRVFRDGRMQVGSVGPIGRIETEQDVESYFQKAALVLLRMLDPYIVAFYLEREERRTGASPSTDAELLASRAYREALGIIQSGHRDSAWAAVLIGGLERRRGENEKAIVWYRKAIDLVEEHGIAPFPLPYHGWGLSLKNLGMLEEANAMYAAALAVDPTFASSYRDWGWSLAKDGDHEQAVEKFTRAVELDPLYADAHHRRGLSLAALGRDREAVEAFAQAAALDQTLSGVLPAWKDSLVAIVSASNIDCAEAGELLLKYDVFSDLSGPAAAGFSRGLPMGCVADKPRGSPR